MYTFGSNSPGLCWVEGIEGCLDLLEMGCIEPRTYKLFQEAISLSAIFLSIHLSYYCTLTVNKKWLYLNSVFQQLRISFQEDFLEFSKMKENYFQEVEKNMYNWQMEERSNNSESGQLIIDNILAYSEANGGLMGKYNLDFYLNHFDRHHLLGLASALPPHRPLTQQDFVQLLLLHIPHPPEETLYLALSLHSLFQAVLERTATASLTIDFSDFTTYLCQKISKDDLDLVVPNQQIVESLQESPEVSLGAPLVLSRVEHQIPKISRELAKKNKKLEEKKSVSRMFYNPAEEKILAVGSLSSTIHQFDLELNAVGEVRPRECRELDKEVGILSVGYNVSNNRIGAILTSGTLVFWEGSDGFTTQKSISLRNYGDKVFFLEQAACWVTVSSNAVNFWDLKEEVVTSTLQVPEAASILDICELPHLRALCLSIVGADQRKSLVLFHEGKRKAVIDLGSAACHSLHYHPGTRTLLPLTYTSSLAIWTVKDLQFDPQLKFVLRGHKGIITCADSLHEAPLLVTGDDAGEIRVWELTYMRCLQAVKLTRWLGGIKLIGEHLLYSDSRINLLPLERLVPPRPEKETPLYLAHQPQEKALWMFTRKDARRVQLPSGRVKEIYELVGEENEISAAVCVGDGFVVGLSSGMLVRYNSDVHPTWRRQGHEGEVKQLLYDSLHRLIWSLGADGRAVAWPERNPQIEEERKVITFNRKPVGILSIAPSSTLLVTGQLMDHDLTLWDYQSLALLDVLQMGGPVTAVTLSQTIELMLVACLDSPLTLLKYSKKEHALEITRLVTLELNAFTPTSLLLTHSLDFIQHTAIVATCQGHLLAYDLSPIILTEFVPPEETPLRESVNILRNQKEEYQTNFSQRGHTQIYNDLPSSLDIQVPAMWQKQMGKESLQCLSSMGGGVVGMLSGQYCKVVDSKTGDLTGSLHASQPLPIRWEGVSDKRGELKQQLYVTLKTLNNILANHGYQMLARQYKMVNVTPFMDLMKNTCIWHSPASSLPPLVSDRPLAHSPLSPKEPSLKALEAYKRVKAIKKISQESMEMPSAPPPLQPQLERDSYLQMLSPDSNTDFLRKYATEKDPHIKALSNRLNDSLSPKLPSKTIKEKENRRVLLDRTSIREGALKDLGQIHKLGWAEKSQNKSIKTILGDLNNKLRQCRLKYSRDTEP